MGPYHHRKKDGSNSNSSRTSPSRIEDAEFVNSLLASKNGDFDEEGLLLSLLSSLLQLIYWTSSALQSKYFLCPE